MMIPVNKIIAIDAGHGSNTAGKRTAPFVRATDINHDSCIDINKGDQYREHYANVGIANLLYQELAKRGYEVIKVGWNDSKASDDEDVSLTARQKRIKAAKCDISISIHFNAFGDGKAFNYASGTGIYIHNYYSGDSKALAEQVLKQLIKGSKQVNRGVTGQALALCNCKTMGTKASILIEVAFMTNEHEAQDFMANSRFWTETAAEIADGIDNYFK